MTFKQVQAWAETKGVIVERKGRKYEVYRADDHSVTGETDTVAELFQEVYDFAESKKSI